ncbi:MAG: single-stranded DNA-binding protein [Bacteroidales bacterium]|nr:single-stranded DNA-binding protein [Bacteroidales bacterium]MCF8390307.1 single-stranded DNA-binding protein [Bacteroidales bacterium]
MSVNKVILVGNVGKDPETRYLEGGAAVSKFSLATSEVYKNKNGEKITNTEWHNIVLWRGLAEIAEKYVKKGSQLYIEGRIRTRSYTDKDGNTRYMTEIVGDTMQMLGRKSDGTSNESSYGSEMSPNTGNQQNSSSQNIQNSKPQDSVNEEPSIGLTDDSSENDDLPF